jgi:hypothetical protein
MMKSGSHNSQPTNPDVPAPNRGVSKSHIPPDSMFFEKIIPALLVLLGLIAIILILFAVGVLIGIVHF